MLEQICLKDPDPKKSKVVEKLDSVCSSSRQAEAQGTNVDHEETNILTRYAALGEDISKTERKKLVAALGRYHNKVTNPDNATDMVANLGKYDKDLQPEGRWLPGDLLFKKWEDNQVLRYYDELFTSHGRNLDGSSEATIDNTFPPLGHVLSGD